MECERQRLGYTHLIRLITSFVLTVLAPQLLAESTFHEYEPKIKTADFHAISGEVGGQSIKLERGTCRVVVNSVPKQTFDQVDVQGEDVVTLKLE